jgi:hypothetical protein
MHPQLSSWKLFTAVTNFEVIEGETFKSYHIMTVIPPPESARLEVLKLEENYYTYLCPLTTAATISSAKNVYLVKIGSATL